MVKCEAKGASVKNGQDSNEDPELADFLQAMQPRSKSKLWANDTMTGKEQERSSTKGNKDRKDKQLKTKPLELNGSSPAQEKPTHMDKGSNEGKVKGKRTSKQLTFEDGKEEGEAKIGGLTDSKILEAGAHDIARDETVSDLDYLKQRTTENWSDDEDTEPFDGSSESLSETENERSSSLKHEMDNPMVDQAFGYLDGALDKLDVQNSNAEEFLAEQQESVSETGRLFVRNLSYTTRYFLPPQPTVNLVQGTSFHQLFKIIMHVEVILLIIISFETVKKTCRSCLASLESSPKSTWCLIKTQSVQKALLMFYICFQKLL